MATLKVEYADRRTRWYTDVDTLQVLNRWIVQDEKDPVGENGWDVDHQCATSGCHCHIETDDFEPHGPQTGVLLELRSGQGRPSTFVLVPEGSAWLMNEAGQTIDRIL